MLHILTHTRCILINQFIAEYPDEHVAYDTFVVLMVLSKKATCLADNKECQDRQYGGEQYLECSIIGD
ncbi:hypothetical protein QE152_g2065 [Popillia japonica]|uniref:Uncharacterized protein n=1 Tax=Popillia japonica TaxID=7064 RepID=A0AAW1N4W5_POPJA